MPNLVELQLRASLDTFGIGDFPDDTSLPFLRVLTLEGFKSSDLISLLTEIDMPVLSSLNISITEASESSELNDVVESPILSLRLRHIISFSVESEYGSEVFGGLPTFLKLMPGLHYLKISYLGGPWSNIAAALRKDTPDLREVEITDCSITSNALVSTIRGLFCHYTTRPLLDHIAIRRCQAVSQEVVPVLQKWTKTVVWEPCKWTESQYDVFV